MMLRALARGGLLCLALASHADAFVRTTTCDPAGGAIGCQPGEVPIEIFWPSACVNYHINPDVGTLDEAAMSAAITQSFEAWNEVGCSNFNLVFAGTTDDDRVGFFSSAGLGKNANVMAVRSDRWDHQRGVLALTSVTFNPANGEIVDADIELNAVDFTLTVGDDRVLIDVANTMTHEAGHFLGLDHSTVTQSTMFATAPLGETIKRSLDEDDVAGLCEAYPEGTTPSTCLGAPAGFFDRDTTADCDERFYSDCDAEFVPQAQSTGCACEVSSADPGPTHGWLLLALLALLVLSRVRKSVWVVVAAASGLLVSLPTAEAFVRTQTCSTSGGTFSCGAGEAPKDIFWPTKCVVYHLNEVGIDDADRDRANSAIIDSFETWNEPQCSGISFEFGGFTDEDRVGFNAFTGADLNANVIVFRNNEWSHEVGVLALTSVTFKPSTGEILDADIELNGRDFRFTTTSNEFLVQIDVANTATHEVGHFLGLDHSAVSESTMFATAPTGEIIKRDLSQDDTDGVCNIYPVEFTPQSEVCGGGPAGFFERPLFGPDDGAPPPEAATCACAGVSGRPTSLAAWPLLLGGVAFALKRWAA